MPLQQGPWEMVYVIEGDICLLSKTALKYLGVIPKTFPMIGEFGGEEQGGDGREDTPHQDCTRSPAQMVFGRTLRDHIPCLPYKYAASADWCITQELK